jgi:hypothetical protein
VIIEAGVLEVITKRLQIDIKEWKASRGLAVVTLRALHLISSRFFNLSLRLLIGAYYNIYFASNPYINYIL